MCESPKKSESPAAGQPGALARKPRRRLLRLVVLAVEAMVGGLAVVIAFRSSVTRSAPCGSTSRQPVAALSVTPPIAAEPNDLFEDVTEKAGLRFVELSSDLEMRCWLARFFSPVPAAVRIRPRSRRWANRW